MNSTPKTLVHAANALLRTLGMEELPLPKTQKTKEVSLTKEEYADDETRAKHFATLIAENAPTAKNVFIQTGDTEIVIDAERVLNPTEGTPDYFIPNISSEEYRIRKELIQHTAGKALKEGHCPYVWDAREDGKVDYTIPLATPKWSAGEIKALAHNHQRKWSVQARLRNRIIAEGKELTNKSAK